MRVVFLGSGGFGVPSLQALVAGGHDVVAVVTQPDRQKGRGLHVAAPPAKAKAQALGLRVLQPDRVREPEAQAALRSLQPDVQIVVAYGQILPASVIAIAPLGTINVHASLLPKYRGAAPIQWAIAYGETVTGVTTMSIDEGLDTGPILLSKSTPIGPEETAPELEQRLSVMGGELLLETLDGLERGTLTPRPQDHASATLAPLLRKEDGRVDWSWPAPKIANRVRGFRPWPGVHVAFAGRSVRLHRVEAATGSVDQPTPGRVVATDAGGIWVACGATTRLLLREVQPESRTIMPGAAFAAGARIAPGDTFT